MASSAWRFLFCLGIMSVGLRGTSGVAVQCATAEDCGLLGNCDGGQCKCYDGYAGESCAMLDLVPAPPRAGLRQQGNRSNWCGTILQDETDSDLWHMYNSDFAGCGLGIWITGSRVIHTKSKGSPVGPYTPTGEVAVAGEAHNPQAIRAPDGTFLLMDSYNGPDAGCATKIDYLTCKPVGCTAGFHGGNCSCPPKMPHGGSPPDHPGTFTFHLSKSAAGPWSPVTVQMDYPCWGLNLTPSPAFHPNGTMYIAFHCDEQMGDVVLVSAPSFHGPFTRVGTRVKAEQPAPAGFGVKPHPEDPFFWVASNGGVVSYHLVLHNNPRGVHFFSADGIEWKLQQKLVSGQPQPPHFFDEHVQYTDGSNTTVKRRERPWILFGKNGAPRVLVTSMEGGNHNADSATWTMAQATSANT